MMCVSCVKWKSWFCFSRSQMRKGQQRQCMFCVGKNYVNISGWKDAYFCNCCFASRPTERFNKSQVEKVKATKRKCIDCLPKRGSDGFVCACCGTRKAKTMFSRQQLYKTVVGKRQCTACIADRHVRKRRLKFQFLKFEI